ncbi:MAG: invasin domain 3-containing protein, partial [Patescibacteria group bacterium]
MKLALAVILGLVLPTIVSAQSVEVEGNVASQVDPAKSTVTAAPTSLLANGVATSVVTVTLRNSSSQTLPNIEVTLTSSRGATDTIGHYEGTTLTPGNSYTSDANGVVMFGVRSSTVGSATVTAVAESLVTLSNKPVITFTSLGGEELDPHPDLSSVTADPTEVSANNSALTVITVILRDKAGTVKPGYEVELISDRGATDYIGHFIGTSLVDGNS